MPRKPRIQEPDTLYHVGSRAVERQPIFGVLPWDRPVFVSLLETTVETYGWRCHAYCVMGNHFHLVLETPRSNLADGMRYLKGRYAAWFNKYAGREGALFERRYWSAVVAGESHVFALAAYVALNPVRVGWTDVPEDWPWSSYAATVGLVRRPSFLHTAALLGWFGGGPDGQARFAAFVRDRMLQPAHVLPARASYGV
jgi:putative transposase